MTADPVAGAGLDLPRGVLDHAARDLGDAPAGVAPDVLMMLPAGLEAGKPIAEVDALDGSLRLQRPDSPEHRRVIAGAEGGADAFQQLIERPGAVPGAGEDLPQLVPDGAGPRHRSQTSRRACDLRK